MTSLLLMPAEATAVVANVLANKRLVSVVETFLLFRLRVGRLRSGKTPFTAAPSPPPARSASQTQLLHVADPANSGRGHYDRFLLDRRSETEEPFILTSKKSNDDLDDDGWHLNNRPLED